MNLSDIGKQIMQDSLDAAEREAWAQNDLKDTITLLEKHGIQIRACGREVWAVDLSLNLNTGRLYKTWARVTVGHVNGFPVKQWLGY